MCRFALWVGWRISLRGKPSARCGQSCCEKTLQLRENTSCSRSHTACMTWKALNIKRQRTMRSLDRALLDDTVSGEHVGGAKVWYGCAWMAYTVQVVCVCIRATVALHPPLGEGSLQ